MLNVSVVINFFRTLNSWKPKHSTFKINSSNFGLFVFFSTPLHNVGFISLFTSTSMNQNYWTCVHWLYTWISGSVLYSVTWRGHLHSEFKSYVIELMLYCWAQLHGWKVVETTKGYMKRLAFQKCERKTNKVWKYCKVQLVYSKLVVMILWSQNHAWSPSHHLMKALYLFFPFQQQHV